MNFNFSNFWSKFFKNDNSINKEPSSSMMYAAMLPSDNTPIDGKNVFDPDAYQMYGLARTPDNNQVKKISVFDQEAYQMYALARGSNEFPEIEYSPKLDSPEIAQMYGLQSGRDTSHKSIIEKLSEGIIEFFKNLFS